MGTTIIAGDKARLTVTVLDDGEPVELSGDVSARIFSVTGRQELVSEFAVTEDDPGASWIDGVVSVPLTPAQTENLDPGDAMLVLSGDFGLKRFKLTVESLFEPTRTSLFVRDLVVDEIRKDRLMAAASGALGSVSVSDDYLWQKVRAAESDIAHELRVSLVPRRYFSSPPTPEQIEELDGMAWEIDDGYDYNTDMFDGDKWGFIVTRNRPIIRVDSLRFAYPTSGDSYFDIPRDWLAVDEKYGYIRIVPRSNAALIGMTGMTLTAIIARRSLPEAIKLEYTAGLENVERDYPELLDVIKKTAILKVLGDAYLPQSGSISSDGHSESISTDMSKYQESIDHSLYGPKGSNGGLVALLHGIRMQVA